MFSRGMLFALASAMMVRRRGFMSGSPPPALAATANSLIRRVKIFPRFASAAPFLCLMECHLECPDMPETLPLFGQDDPDIRALVPGASAVVAEHGFHQETRTLEAARHLRDRERPEGELEAMGSGPPAAPLQISLLERRQGTPAVLANRLDEREVRAAHGFASELNLIPVLAPIRYVRDEVDAEGPTTSKDTRDRRERSGQVAFTNERLKDAVRREHRREPISPE